MPFMSFNLNTYMLLMAIGCVSAFTQTILVQEEGTRRRFWDSSTALAATRNEGKEETVSAQPKIPLNKEIFRLRRAKNGISLAERRLDRAIKFMLKEENTAKLIETNLESIDPDLLSQLPDETSFNSVLSSYAKARKAIKAEALLRQMQELSDTFPHLKPSIFSYNAVLEAYSNLIGNNRNERRSEQSRSAIFRLFHEVLDFASSDNNPIEPNTYTYNLVLAANAPSSEKWQALEKWALDFLDDKPQNLIPDRRTYNQLLKCYGVSGSADKALALINKIIEVKGRVAKKYTIDMEPNVVCFNLVFKALATYQSKSNESLGSSCSASQQADSLLARMYDLYENGIIQLRPGTETYNHILNVQARSGNTERAEELVKELENIFSSGRSAKRPRPDLITYTTLIKAYSTRQHISTREIDNEELTRIASNATNVFRKMRSLSDKGFPNVAPSIVTYNTLLNIWSHCGTRESLEMAMNILQELNNDRQCWADSVTYTTLIHGWSRGVRHLTRLPEAGYRAEQLLLALENLPSNRIKPNFSRTTVYNSVITAWSKSADTAAAQRVDALLQQLESKYFNGDMNAQPDKTTFLCMIDAYAKACLPDAEERCDAILQRMFHFRDVFQLEELEPDRAVYNAVLNALAKSRQAGAVEKAEEILTMMQTSTDTKLRPDIVTYATVIDCHTKCGEGSRRADELLRFVEGSYRGGDIALKPNAVFYSAILQAYAKTATDEGARKAEDLLRRNLALYEEGYDYAKPHGIMYNAVMDAIARTGEQTAGSRAEDLLKEMELLSEAGNVEMKPSRRSFNAVILGYRNEGDGGKKAEEVLMRMEQLSNHGSPELAPDVVSYNCAIGAIVHDSQHHDDAADRAQALLDRMEERNILPDGRTYSPVIEAWLRRKDKKGKALAEIMLKRFLERVEASKKQKPSSKNHNNRRQRSLHEDEVWQVVNRYNNDEAATEDHHIGSAT